jgi:hypothetical protein
MATPPDHPFQAIVDELHLTVGNSCDPWARRDNLRDTINHRLSDGMKRNQVQ